MEAKKNDKKIYLISFKCDITIYNIFKERLFRKQYETKSEFIREAILAHAQKLEDASRK